ncbi:MAG: hypothetical protein LBH52_01205, partial [Puniceicoccales bacterium]|nr:hypothetical protein [Puniceicoccales bacterium]
MVADLGEQKFFESWYPGTLVDSAGDLYAIRNDTGGWGGCGWYINRISANSQNGISGDWNGCGIGDCDGRYGHPLTLSLSDASEETLFKTYGWHILQPCIAQEVNGTTDYLYIFVFAPPARWTGTSSNNDIEGIGWVKMQKSKISRAGGHIAAAKLFPGKEKGVDVYKDMKVDTFVPLNSNYNQNTFTAIHDVGAGRTTLYWVATQLNRLHLNNDGNDVHSGVNHDLTKCTISDDVQWRILKGNNAYYLLGVNAIDPHLLKATASQSGDVLKGDIIEKSAIPFEWYSIVESGYAQRRYHSDIGMVKASDGTEVLLMLQMAKGSYFTAIDNRWSASY